MPSEKLDIIYNEMKELHKDELKEIAYNCRKATFLIEKKQIGKLTIREKVELKIHLAGCSVCCIYEKQSKTINRVVKDLFHAPRQSELSLDENFKRALQQKIEQKLNEG